MNTKQTAHLSPSAPRNTRLARRRLLTATAPGLSAAYAYDPLGRRNHKSGTGVTETYFLDDGDDEIAEYDGTKTLTVFYIPGPAIDEPIAMVTASTGAKEYFHTNHQGSVIAMSDATGAKAEGPYTYDPYGNCFSGAGVACSAGEPYRFTGRRFDPETGLLYFRARYYAPDDAHGSRFLQTDPVGYTADLDLYTYVGNDPVDRTDPRGMYDGFTLEDLGFVNLGSGIVVPESEVQGNVAAFNAAPKQFAQFSLRTAYELSPLSSAVDVVQGAREGDLNKFTFGAVGLIPAGKIFSAEKAALVEMARMDKRLGATVEDMKAYSELNAQLPDPFHPSQVRIDPPHMTRGPQSQVPHGHVGPVGHIPIREKPKVSCTGSRIPVDKASSGPTCTSF